MHEDGEIQQNPGLLDIKGHFRKGPMSMVQWNRTFLLVKSFKLVPRLLDEGSWQKKIKLWFSLHDIILERKPIGSNKQN